MTACAKMRYFGPARGPRLRVCPAHMRVLATKIPLQETETDLKDRKKPKDRGVVFVCAGPHDGTCKNALFWARPRVWSAHTRVPGTKIQLQGTQTGLKDR